MNSKINFSQHKCWEIAALSRIMLDMQENRLTLLTRIATIIECDYNGAMRLSDLANEIMNPKTKPGPMMVRNCIHPACPRDAILGTDYCEQHDGDM